MGTVIVGSALVLLVGSIIWHLVKEKKNGKSIQCGCDCKNCRGGCH